MVLKTWLNFKENFKMITFSTKTIETIDRVMKYIIIIKSFPKKDYNFLSGSLD